LGISAQNGEIRPLEGNNGSHWPIVGVWPIQMAKTRLLPL
jgi:hypothetical protein